MLFFLAFLLIITPYTWAGDRDFWIQNGTGIHLTLCTLDVYGELGDSLASYLDYLFFIEQDSKLFENQIRHKSAFPLSPRNGYSYTPSEEDSPPSEGQQKKTVSYLCIHASDVSDASKTKFIALSVEQAREIINTPQTVITNSLSPGIYIAQYLGRKDDRGIIVGLDEQFIQQRDSAITQLAECHEEVAKKQVSPPRAHKLHRSSHDMVDGTKGGKRRLSLKGLVRSVSDKFTKKTTSPEDSPHSTSPRGTLDTSQQNVRFGSPRPHSQPTSPRGEATCTTTTPNTPSASISEPNIFRTRADSIDE